uniref:HMG box domain-containing protein n=1 Tax=Glossina brevipalpis TaxID=37001 RepID=A0A1A9X3P8_9MUSC
MPRSNEKMDKNKYLCCGCLSEEKVIQAPEKSACKVELYMNSTAPTAFFVYLYEFRQILKQGGARKLRQVDICKTAGKNWRKLSECGKQPYKIWAKKNREKRRCVIKAKRQRVKKAKNSCQDLNA